MDRIKNGIIREYSHGGFYVQDADNPARCYRLKREDLKKDLRDGDEVYLIPQPLEGRWKGSRWAKSITLKNPRRGA
jgi:hypothetical protein